MLNSKECPEMYREYQDKSYIVIILINLNYVGHWGISTKKYLESSRQTVHIFVSLLLLVLVSLNE